MLTRFNILASLVLCVLVLAGCTPKDKAEDIRYFDPRVDVWPHDLSDIAPDPDVVYGQLDNGMRYALQKNARPEGEAVVRFRISAGSRHETDETLGLAHYLEHMAFNGSENVPEGEMVKSLERLGLSFGADTNASTTFSRTQYMLNLPDVGDETVDFALFIMRETADKLLIEPEAVERERGVVKAEEARGNTPGRKASREYVDYLYPGTLSVRRPVIGLPETLDTISAEQLRAFYDSYYRPERALLVITGDFDIETMRKKIETVFGDWTNNTVNPEEADPGEVKHREPDARIYHDEELTTNIVMFDAKPGTYRRDTIARRRENFIRNNANAIVNKRIQKQLLDSGAAVRSAGISYSSRRYGDQIFARASAKNDDWESAIALLDAEIRTALTYGFQQAEYDELIANNRRSLTDSANYAAKRRSGSLASGVVGGFAGAYVRTTPQQHRDFFEANVEAVTVEDLEAAFQTMWSDFDPLFWLQGPKAEDITKDDILTAYADVKSRPVAQPEQRKKLEFAYQDFGTPGEVISRSRTEDYDIDHIVFDNNVRLNLKKTDFEDKWVRMDVTVGEGWNAFPKDKPAVQTLAGAFSLGGFEAHKVNELSEIFAGKSIGVSMSVDSQHLTFAGATNPDDVEDQLKTWTAMLTNPGYRPEWKEKFIEGIQASFHTIDSTPGGVAARDLRRIWANGDPRFGYLPQADYEAATLEEVKAVLDPIFKNGAIEIGVVGDFDKDAIIAAIAKTYGALPMRRKAFDPIPEAFELDFPSSDRVTLTHTGAENQGAIFMAWPTTGEWSLEKSRRYGMIRRIFQNRMTEIIREDMGLTYSPGAGLNYSDNYVDYGYVSASMTSDPQFFAPFEKAAKEIATDLRSGGITQDELDRARKPILEGFERSEKENGSWLNFVALSQTDKDYLDWRRSRVPAYTGMTTADLDAAAKTLFDPATLHVVVIGPESAP